MKINFKLEKKHLPFLILLCFGILLNFIGLYNHYSFKTYTYDYANYNFAFWDYAHFKLSPLTTFRGNFLQDHFSLTLMYFVPLYWLLNWITGTYTLIIIQNILILIAARYTYKVIQLKTDNQWVSIGALLYFFLLFGRYSAFGTDVNLAIMSACFVPIFIYYFEVKKYWIALIIFVLALFSRENMSLWFVFIFLVYIVNNFKNRKMLLICSTGIVASLAFFVVLFKFIIPGLETPGVEYALFNYSALGADPGEALNFIVHNPIESVKLFFINHLSDPMYDGIKMEFYWLYFFSGGVLLFLRPQYIIWFIPIIAQKVLNDDPFRWGNGTYYAIEVVTLLPIAVFLVISSFKSKKIQNLLVLASCFGAIYMTAYKMKEENHKIQWTFKKEKINFLSEEFYTPPFNIRRVNEMLDNIPNDAKVSSSNLITPHIAQRQYIYYFPTVKNAQYIVFSVEDDCYLYSAEQNAKDRNEYLNSPDWEIIDKEYPVYVLKKKVSSN